MCAYLEWWSKEQRNKLFLPSSPVTSVIIQLYKSFLCKCWVFICTLTWSERDETVKQGRYLKIQTEETTEIQKYWELNTQTFLKTSFRLVSCTDVSHRLAAGRQGGRPSVPFTPERVHLRWKRLNWERKHKWSRNGEKWPKICRSAALKRSFFLDVCRCKDSLQYFKAHVNSWHVKHKMSIN